MGAPTSDGLDRVGLARGDPATPGFSFASYPYTLLSTAADSFPSASLRRCAYFCVIAGVL